MRKERANALPIGQMFDQKETMEQQDFVDFARHRDRLNAMPSKVPNMRAHPGQTHVAKVVTHVFQAAIRMSGDAQTKHKTSLAT